MEDYRKAPFTCEQHLALLQYRGLTIDNIEEAIRFLQQVNYYRFTAYCVPFQKPHDVFLPGNTFDSVVGLYRLDEELRNAVFAVLTPIEIFIKTKIAYELSHRAGAFAHYDDSLFLNKVAHKQWLTVWECQQGGRSGCSGRKSNKRWDHERERPSQTDGAGKTQIE